MKKSALTLLLFVLIPVSLLVQGSIYKSGTLVRIPESDYVQNQVMSAGETVEMSGWVGNDFLSAARFLMLKGTVSDDAILAGRQVIVDGEVGDLLMGAG